MIFTLIIVTFGLNALYGRHRVLKGFWQGAGNSSNARDFIEYTISKGYPVDSWEFGNNFESQLIVENCLMIIKLHLYTFLHGSFIPLNQFFFNFLHGPGNELSGRGVLARVDAERYGKDLICLKAILDELYRKSRSKPLLVAPGGFFDNQKWYAKLLEVSGPSVLNAMSHHVYNLGPGDETMPEELVCMADLKSISFPEMIITSLTKLQIQNI